MVRKIIFIATLLLLTSCEKPTPIDKEFDKTGESLVITVYTYKNEQQLTRALIAKNEELNTETPYPDKLREGWAAWNKYSCDIHILEPRHMRDFETLGHEMAHCLYGTYHKEGVR